MLWSDGQRGGHQDLQGLDVKRTGARMRRMAVLCLVAGWAVPAMAVAPVLNQVMPRGVQRGGDVQISLHGTNLEDAVGLLFHGTGVVLKELIVENPQKLNATITVAPDCPLGTQSIRVYTRSGVTNPRLFSVGALVEVQEEEPNDDPAAAAAVGLGTTINGTITNEDVDYFAVELDVGARLAVELEGLRLGTALFDPKVRLFGPGGHEFLAEDDTPLVRQDSAFVFVAEEAGRHVLAVSEASYGGGNNFHYRLHVGAFPRPMSGTPLGGTPGLEQAVQWLGDPGIAAQTVAFASDAAGLVPVYPATDTGVAPSPIYMRAIPYPTTVEAEPNNNREQATPGPVPGAFDGVIGEDGDTDWFAFEGTANMNLDIRVWARELGSPLDSVLVVRGPDGKGLQSNDDAHGADSAVRVTLPADGSYTIQVRDHLDRGGASFAYRVEAVPVTPNLSLRLPERETGDLVVHQGNSMLFLMNLTRTDFGGPVEVLFPNLPEGVTAHIEPFPDGQTTIPVVFTAASDAPLAGTLLEAVGRHTGESPAVEGGIEQQVVFVYGANRSIFHAETYDRIGFAVAEPAPYSLEIVPPKVPLVQSGIMQLTVKANRADGFTAPIELRVPWTPSGMGAATAQIPEGANETQLQIEATGSAAPAVYKLAVLGKSGAYEVGSPFVPVEVAAPWVNFAFTPVETTQGEPTSVAVAVTVPTPFEGRFETQLYGLPKGVATEPQPLTKETTELVFPVTVAEDAPAGKHESIGIQTTLVAQDEPILHRAGGGHLTIHKPLPPNLRAAAPPPEEKKPDQPERKTRFPGS